MKRLCFSFCNVNIIQLNVAMWGPLALSPDAVYQWWLCTCCLPYL